MMEPQVPMWHNLIHSAVSVMISYRITTHDITMTITAGAKQQYSDRSAHTHDTVVKVAVYILSLLFQVYILPGLIVLQSKYALSNATGSGVTAYSYMHAAAARTHVGIPSTELLTKEGHTSFYCGTSIT